MTRRIVTEFVCPPIPIREVDWRATLDGYEPGDPMGIGPTEAAAIADLQEQIMELWAGYEEWLDAQADAYAEEMDRERALQPDNSPPYPPYHL